MGIGPVRSPEAVPRVETAESGERERAHRTRAVGGAIDQLVVQDHDFPVRRRVHVELEVVRARADAGHEGIERVLRRDTGRPAMAEEPWPRAFQVARTLTPR